MKKWKHFRAFCAISLSLILVWLIWGIVRGGLSAVMIASWAVMLLAVGALGVNNQRNEAFHDAAFLSLTAAYLVLVWTPTRGIPQGVINFAVSLLFVWYALKPYYIKWKSSRIPTDGSSASPVVPVGKSNG